MTPAPTRDEIEGPDEIKPTDEERRAITALRRVAKGWPETLWLFSASGSLCVMRRGPDGGHALLDSGGCDPAYVLATIDIPNDGGDW